jgi:succinate dehydrogenase/fumarate reductase-like Fe-S protein
MSAVVVDAPVAAAWLLDHKSDPGAEAARDLLEQTPGVAPCSSTSRCATSCWSPGGATGSLPRVWLNVLRP